ncbi:MAG: hypothetical protein WB987_01035 [Candidatus Acidiferrales bacterium]
MHWNRILAIPIVFLFAIPVAADLAAVKNPQDRTQIFHDVIVGPNGTANVVQCFGCNVYVRGHVTGDVFTGGGSIYISGLVDGNALAVGGHIEAQSGGELRGHAAAVGGYVTASGQGRIDRDSLSMPFAIVPGQYRPTPIGIGLLVAVNLLCIAFACSLLRPNRVDNTAWTIWNRKNMVLLTGIIALLIAWGIESLGEHMGRAEVSANTLLAVIVIVIGSAGATGLGRLVGGVAFPRLASIRAALAGIFALTMLEVIPLFGFFVFSIGMLISLGAAVVSGFGSRAVPAAESPVPQP